MSHTYKSTIKGDTTVITVDETIDQLAEPGNWAEVVKQTAADKKAAEKAAKEAAETAELEAEIAAEAKAKADAEAAAGTPPVE
jgi:hypothetical protein